MGARIFDHTVAAFCRRSASFYANDRMGGHAIGHMDLGQSTDEAIGYFTQKGYIK